MQKVLKTNILKVNIQYGNINNLTTIYNKLLLFHFPKIKKLKKRNKF